MRKVVLLASASLVLLFSHSLLAQNGARPATVGQAGDSFAMQLHYPPKERAAGVQGVVKFYCEVNADGKAGHISTLCGKGQGRFATMVENALRRGHSNPATVNGKPITVLLGGTVLFLMNGGRPTISVTLATAEGEKIAAMTNYLQPQMIDSDAMFRRKIYSHRDKYHYRDAAHPGATIRVHLDAGGRVLSKEIESESPPNGGRGRLLLDVVDEEHFIPAQANGQAVAGDFEMAVDFEYMQNPDRDPELGTLIKKDSD